MFFLLLGVRVRRRTASLGEFGGRLQLGDGPTQEIAGRGIDFCSSTSSMPPGVTECGSLVRSTRQGSLVHICGQVDDWWTGRGSPFIAVGFACSAPSHRDADPRRHPGRSTRHGTAPPVRIAPDGRRIHRAGFPPIGSVGIVVVVDSLMIKPSWSVGPARSRLIVDSGRWDPSIPHPHRKAAERRAAF